jgi:hypothetical protein
MIEKIKLWIKQPENYFYVILVIICLAIGSRRYNIWLLIGGTIILFVLSFLIGKLILKNRKNNNS